MYCFSINHLSDKKYFIDIQNGAKDFLLLRTLIHEFVMSISKYILV